MSKMIRVVTKQEGMFKTPKVETVEHGYKTMQRLVTPEGEDSGGSMIECVYVQELSEHGIDLWLNEEGKVLGLKPNFMLFGGRDVAVGPVFFASVDDEGETIGLTDKQVEVVLAFMKATPQAIVA